MSDINISKLSPIKLVKYIEKDHCTIKHRLQKIQTLLQKACDLPNDSYTTADALAQFYPSFKTELEDHFDKEESILFPYIHKMHEFKLNPSKKFKLHRGGIKNPISQIEYDHDQTEKVMFDILHQITKDYKISENTSNPLKAVYEGLKDIESMIKEHINIETERLFPLAIEMELNLIHKR